MRGRARSQRSRRASRQCSRSRSPRPAEQSIGANRLQLGGPRVRRRDKKAAGPQKIFSNNRIDSFGNNLNVAGLNWGYIRFTEMRARCGSGGDVADFPVTLDVCRCLALPLVCRRLGLRCMKPSARGGLRVDDARSSHVRRVRPGAIYTLCRWPPCGCLSESSTFCIHRHAPIPRHLGPLVIIGTPPWFNNCPAQQWPRPCRREGPLVILRPSIVCQRRMPPFGHLG
jgi:hypothetical protein